MRGNIALPQFWSQALSMRSTNSRLLKHPYRGTECYPNRFGTIDTTHHQRYPRVYATVGNPFNFKSPSPSCITPSPTV
eukprot:scaffold28361_cov129-Isochrysis_galbana.AAC.2